VNVGILGGTFDPPHNGHLIVAQDAALALGLDRILFIPAARPPHKQNVTISPAELRAGMLRRAIEGDPRFGLDLLELERTGPSWTVDTLRALSQGSPGTRWTLLMGVDQYAEFGSWREPGEIRGLARIGVLSRSGLSGGVVAAGAADLAQLRTTPLPDGDMQVEVTRIDISSTQIRARVAAGLPIRYLVPAAVEDFIFETGLYSRNGPVAAG
jgi:nicotinate-nucleotide adenylyltransferase